MKVKKEKTVSAFWFECLCCTKHWMVDRLADLHQAEHLCPTCRTASEKDYEFIYAITHGLKPRKERRERLAA